MNGNIQKSKKVRLSVNRNFDKLNYWYSLIVESREFNDIMKKYKVWESSDSPLITNFIT